MKRKINLIKILGWFFLIFSILILVSTIGNYIKWKNVENQYEKQYVYSNYGLLYYDDKEHVVYVDKIYNTNNEIIELNVPNKKTVLMYCDKDKNSECIYFDMNNTIDQTILNPILGLLTTLFLFALAVGILYKPRKNSMQNNNLSNLYLGYVFLFTVGITFVIWQLTNLNNYLNLKNENNVTIATIYSDIYNMGGKKESYKPVAYYYVNNKKYIYEYDVYIDGRIEDNIGKSFELYYSKENPNLVCKKEKPVNAFFLLTGIGLIIFDFPFVFFKRKMESRISKKKK